jgi:hypothetical protein
VNSSEAARKLGTTSKELRRFLRADPSYTNAASTSSGRYNFTDSEFSILQRRFTAWQSKNAGRKRAPRVDGDASEPRTTRKRSNDQPGLPTGFATRKLYTSEREQRDRLSRERVERLEQQLLATGLHISQMRTREREVS